MSPNRVITRTGIVIGGAYLEPPPGATSDAEEIQRLLIEKRRANLHWHFAHLVLYAVLLGFAGACLMGVLRT